MLKLDKSYKNAQFYMDVEVYNANLMHLITQFLDFLFLLGLSAQI